MVERELALEVDPSHHTVFESFRQAPILSRIRSSSSVFPAYDQARAGAGDDEGRAPLLARRAENDDVLSTSDQCKAWENRARSSVRDTFI